MTKTHKHRYISITFLAAMYVTSAICVAQSTSSSGFSSVANVRSSLNTRETSSRAQSSGDVVQAPSDLFSYMPASDGLITLDVKRVINEALPRLIAGDQDMRALVVAIADLKTVRGLDPRAMQRLVMGLRYTNPGAGTSQRSFDAVGVAQSSEAGQLQTLVHKMGPGKFREQQYRGKFLYIAQLDQTETKRESTETSTTEEPEWAVVALDTNTLVFGDAPYVRASIDLNSGKGTKVSAELAAAVKRSPNALLSVAGLLPPSLMSAAQSLVNSEMSRTLSSLKNFYASVDLKPAGFEVLVSLNTTSAEQSKTLADVLSAFKTLSGSLAAGKTTQDKLVRELVKGLVILAVNNEVRVSEEFAQSTVDILVKQVSSAMYIDQGLAQMAKGDPEGAIASYEKAIILDPESVVAFINRGKARADKGTLDAAIADYDKAISLDPNWARIYNNRGFARVKKGDFDAAIADLDKAISLDPTDAYAFNNRGMALAGKGNLDKAMADYDKSIALDAENALAYQNRGNARNQTGDWNGAIADFERVVTINPKWVDAYNGRGLAHYYKGELDQAFADYEKAIALDPRSAIAYNNRGLAFVAKEDPGKAIADFDKSIALDPKSFAVYQNRGDVRAQKGDWDGAIMDFDNAITVNPKSAVSYNGRGLAHYYKGEFDLAIADYDRGIALDPNAIIYSNRGHARSQKKDWNGAIADFDRSISIDPTFVEAYNGRGLARHNKEDLDQAIADYDKAIALDPNYAEVYGNRALSRLTLSRDAEAEQDFKKCFELDESLRPNLEALAKEVRKTRRNKPLKKH